MSVNKSTSENKKIGIVIVDQHPVVLYALQSFFKDYEVIKVLGEAGSCETALDIVQSLMPDVVIIDIFCREISGVELSRKLLTLNKIKVLAFCEEHKWDVIEVFLRSGGAGYVSKYAPLSELLEAVQAVARGEKWLPPDLPLGAPAPAALRIKPCPPLTARECEIVILIAQGFTTNQIAERLNISAKTVETHRQRIFKKLGFKNRSQLVGYAVEKGLVAA